MWQPNLSANTRNSQINFILGCRISSELTVWNVPW